ncbi:hypothetical protein DERP_000630 [Dermatophagoides pteronyssinus]|uniref:Uncharacterized protein n=1 Tax=Dermatophagoides pteronyssinus TaxID=6956 RepID=A0ABQ8J0S0_DERPT|nr:hypothetical protein DERP_000630 [Dermatophagoides pteronyssinus]
MVCTFDSVNRVAARKNFLAASAYNSTWQKSMNNWSKIIKLLVGSMDVNHSVNNPVSQVFTNECRNNIRLIIIIFQIDLSVFTIISHHPLERSLVDSDILDAIGHLIESTDKIGH